MVGLLVAGGGWCVVGGGREWLTAGCLPGYLAFHPAPGQYHLVPVVVVVVASPLLPAALAAAAASAAAAVAVASTSTGHTLFSSAYAPTLTPPEPSPGPYLIEIDPRQYEELHSRCCFRSCDHRVCPSKSPVSSAVVKQVNDAHHISRSFRVMLGHTGFCLCCEYHYLPCQFFLSDVSFVANARSVKRPSSYAPRTTPQAVLGRTVSSRGGHFTS